MTTLPHGTPLGGVAPIAVLNQSTVVTDADVQKAVAAMAVQISRDFAPIWNVDAHLTFYSKADAVKVPATSWVLYVLDNADQAGEGGVHDISPTGMPIGKVFAKTDMAYKASWTVAMSHELLEMLGDPQINRTVFAQSSNTTGIIYALETCDACEDDRDGYMIDGVLVSDFVTPAWFEDWRQSHSARFDFRGLLSQPFQLLPGGYISTFDARGGGWSQKTMATDKANPALRRHIGSRFERRQVGRDRWVMSDTAES